MAMPEPGLSGALQQAHLQSVRRIAASSSASSSGSHSVITEEQTNFKRRLPCLLRPTNR